MSSKALFRFIQQRYRIYLAKEADAPKPWTTDAILQTYRFCNVYREHDTVTKWIAENWREPNRDDPYLWFAMTVARLVNWPASLEQMGYPVPWNPARFCDVLGTRMRRGDKAFSGAYLVNQKAIGGEGMAKFDYLVKYVLDPLWKDRDKITTYTACDLTTTYHYLTGYVGIGTFMAAQIIADLKYASALKDAPDWWTWAASGPGSRRGINRILGNQLTKGWKEEPWREALLKLSEEIFPMLKEAGMPRMHAQDLQNCLCEWDKYERVRLGEGKPRSLYNGR